MQKVKLAGALLLTGIILLGGCGNSTKNAANPNREEANIVRETDTEGGSLETGAGYGFNKFDLDIEVDGKDAIEADYTATKPNDADYENKLTNINLKANEALNELDKLFMDILITKDTPQQEVIDKILKWYGLDVYSKFELEVDFDDGTRLHINDRK